MTESSSPAPDRLTPRRRGGARLLGLAVMVALALVLLALVALYLGRREAAREVLVGWLDRRGIQADVEVERIELDGFIARVRIGDPADPDVTIERVEVDYAIAAPWSETGLGLRPSRIRLLRPIVRASWMDGRFSLGALDPLIEEFTSRPPQADTRGPLVLVEKGRLRLTTEYGPVQVLGDARIDDGRLMRLSARMPTAALRSGDLSASVEAAAVEATTTGDRIVIGLNSRLNRLQTGETILNDAVVTLGGSLPYPDLKGQRGDGAVTARGAVSIAALDVGGQTSARDVEAALAFAGTNTGWIDLFRLMGRSDLTLSAEALTTPGVATRTAHYRTTNAQTVVERTSQGLGWSLEGPAIIDAAALTLAGMQMSGVDANASRMVAGGRNGAFEITGPLDVRARGFEFDTLRLDDVRGRLDMDITQDGLLQVRAEGGLSARDGAWPLFGPVGGDDVAELAEMKRALGSFALSAPGVRIHTGATGTEVVLDQPVRLTPGNGGVLTIAPVSRPIFSAPPGQNGGGAMRLSATRGRGLPELDMAVPDWGLTGDGFRARLDGEAALDFAMARGATISTRGILASGGGTLTYVADDCAEVTTALLDLGENDVSDLAGRLCPVAGVPLVTSRNGRWQVVSQLEDVAASVPFLAVAATDGGGRLTVTGAPSGVGLTMAVDRANLSDTTDPIRFNPLTIVGRAALADETWTGRFSVAVEGHTLGAFDIAHQGRTGAGGVTLDASGLAFTPEGLQPTMVTPLLDGLVQSPVSGSVDFTGRFDWTEDTELTSSGALTTRGLNFDSPVGAVTGLRGDIAFLSLTPLVTAPDQHLNIERIDAFAPMTDLEVDFGLAADSVTISGAEVVVGEGVIRILPFALPLTPNTPWSGVLVLEHVQLGDLVAGTGLRDKVMLDAVVDGSLPFQVDADGDVTIADGALGAIQPGRLSIPREALSGVEAGGGSDEVPPNVVQDLAYQAMENLSFTTLSANVNSARQGRLAVVFHIIGEHQPPVPQELRLTLQELLNRDFLNRELPLPSGTAVDLTLDTTINLDELLADWASVQRARAGQGLDPPDGS